MFPRPQNTGVLMKECGYDPKPSMMSVMYISICDLDELLHSILTMIVPDIYHRDLGIGHSKQSLRKPHRVTFQVECLKLFLHFLCKFYLMLLNRVLKLEPFLEELCLL